MFVRFGTITTIRTGIRTVDGSRVPDACAQAGHGELHTMRTEELRGEI
jgi:hypothetical protein